MKTPPSPLIVSISIISKYKQIHIRFHIAHYTWRKCVELQCLFSLFEPLAFDEIISLCITSSVAKYEYRDELVCELEWIVINLNLLQMH